MGVSRFEDLEHHQFQELFEDWGVVVAYN